MSVELPANSVSQPIMHYKIPYCLFIVFLLIPDLLQAQVSLPDIFDNHMVIQQNTDARIWGWGNAGSQVKVSGSWAPEDTVSTKVNDNGSWELRIKTAKAGGPYQLTVTGVPGIPPNTLIIKDVFLGEVWLCSGQSNMEWSAYGPILNAKEEIQAATNSNIRFCRVLKKGADTPQNNASCNWEISTPQVMPYQSAVAYFFARKLQRELNVPVGIIVAAWGGTPAEVWTPKSSIDKLPEVKASLPLQKFQWWPTEPGVLYNQMIHPISKYTIAGALWYQGESNHERAGSYGPLLKTMISDWRKDFESLFPFYLVQIAPYQYKSANNGPALVREAQEWITANVPSTGMVVVSDLVDNLSDIHPRNKQGVGLRLANLALAKTYGRLNGGYLSPTFKAAKIAGHKMLLTIKDAPDGLVVKGKNAEGFMIAGEDNKYMPAKASINRGVIELTARDVKHPVKARYCFDDASTGNVFSKAGLPLAPFRTDRKW